MNALIGYTGFVGNILKKDIIDCDYYNTKNINEINGKVYDTIFCCGISGVRWLANQNEKKDLEQINNLLTNLKLVKQCNNFILISTIAIYDDEPYGKNRRYAEDEILDIFDDVYIFRLPSVYGDGLKKNLLFDLLHNSIRTPINIMAQMQWYNVDDLYNDITSPKYAIPGIYELYPEPLYNSELVELFDNGFDNTTKGSMYKVVVPENGYIYSSELVLQKLSKYIKKERLKI